MQTLRGNGRGKKTEVPASTPPKDVNKGTENPDTLQKEETGEPKPMNIVDSIRDANEEEESSQSDNSSDSSGDNDDNEWGKNPYNNM